LARTDLDVARIASGLLEQIINQDQKISRKVLSRLEDLPAMLRVSGLPATLAFFADRAAKPGALGAAYTRVSQVLLEETRKHVSAATGTDRILPLITKLAEAPVDEQALAFTTVDALAMWLRRLAKAVVLEQDAGGEGGHD
jgi:CRISPR type III-B/RAMP module-associated protein Cmr5